MKIHELKEAYFRNILEALGEAVLITSPWQPGIGFEITYANPAFFSMTGYTREDIVGRSPKILQGALTDPETVREMHLALASGQSFHGRTINYRKDQSTYVVEWRITPVKDALGQITNWIAVQRDVSEFSRTTMKLELLAQELNHRVKNMFATVQAIVNATSRASRTPLEFQISLAGRLTSLAKAHDLLTGHHELERHHVMSFRELLHSEMDVYDTGSSSRLRFTGEDIDLPAPIIVPLSMAIHELTTNAVKYGALSGQEGWVDVAWVPLEHDGLQWLLCKWTEHGGPPVKPPSRQGFGSRLLRRALAEQFRARVEIFFEPEGVRAEIEIPFPPYPSLMAATSELTAVGSALAGALPKSI